MIDLVFSSEPLPNVVTRTIFLAGPSDRYYPGSIANTDTWRHNVVKEFENNNFNGTIIIPIPRECFYGNPIKESIDYLSQMEWEEGMLNSADIIFTWVDRNIEENRFALTTNIEFGMYYNSGRMIYGRPSNASNVRYLDNKIHGRDGDVFNNIESMVSASMKRLLKPCYRSKDQVIVPALFWNTEQFQTWYKHQCLRGNYLIFFKPKSVITFNKDNFLFGFAAHVGVFVSKENRSKTNEWIFSRTSTSYIVPYFIDKEGNKQFVLVSKFITPANNLKGKVYEFPGGSAMKEGVNPFYNAYKELEEKTGLSINQERFEFVKNIQSMATFCTANIFITKVKLTDDEIIKVSQFAKDGTILGENEEERITLHIASEKEIIEGKDYPLDLVNLGMLYAARV